MAEAIGLTMGAMSLASLFSTCIECFGYFSASRDFERDRNILLVKLDFERNKLLIWGNAAGVLRETSDGLLKALSRGKDTDLKSRKQLECIISILTDAEKLQENYGVRSSEGQRKESISWSLVSKNNLDLFKLTFKRFLLRNPKEAAEYRKYKVWAKLKWAIHDKQKFQGLINDLKELVDQLFLIQLNAKLLVNPNQLDRCMKTDIELIDNIEQLRLVQEACEDSYRAWSDHAGSVIAASENGTIDRRTFEEISKDVYNAVLDIPTIELEKSVLQGVIRYQIPYKLHVILTDECLLYSQKMPCDVGASLGTEAIYEQSFIMATEGNSEWEKTASPNHIFEPEISRLLLKSLQDEKDSKSRRLHDLILAEKLTDNQKQYLNMVLPLVKIRLYVAPCSCLLMTAIDMCRDLRTQYVHAIIRPDHRLRSSCCSGQNGLQRMREIADKIRGAHGFEPEGYDPDYLDQLDEIDLTWVESMIFKHDEEQTEQSASFTSAIENFSFGYEDATCDLLIIIGEARVLGPEMVKHPFTRRARVPKQSEVYGLIRDYSRSDEVYKWKFDGRFTSKSNYQWCSLDPALNAIKESSPPLLSTTTDWSIERRVQEQEAPSSDSISILGNLNVQEKSKQNTFLPAKLEIEVDKGSLPAETILAA